MTFEFNKDEVDLRREEFFRENREVYGEIAKELYQKYHYTNPIVLKNLKKELPLRVTLLNKITIYGMTILEGYIIEYAYFFNDNINLRFCYKPSLYKMMKWGE